MIEVNGIRYATDEHGYLENSDVWNIDIAHVMAENDDQELTETHIWVINFLQDYYKEYHICPAVRILNRAIGKQFGPDKANSQFLYGLFPYGPARQACKYAGLPKPTGCV